MKIQYFQTTFIYLLWPKICLHDSTYVLPEFVSVASQSRHDLGFLGNLRGFGISRQSAVVSLQHHRRRYQQDQEHRHFLLETYA